MAARRVIAPSIREDRSMVIASSRGMVCSRRQTITRDEAMTMLRSSRIDGAITLRAAIHPLLLDRYKALSTSLLSIWEELGVKVEVATPTMASYLEAFQNSQGIDLFIGRWNVDYDDPDDFTYGLFHSRVGMYRSYITSPEGETIHT